MLKIRRNLNGSSGEWRCYGPVYGVECLCVCVRVWCASPVCLCVDFIAGPCDQKQGADWWWRTYKAAGAGLLSLSPSHLQPRPAAMWNL